MSTSQSYPIGTPGKKWGEVEKAVWLGQTAIKRSYRDEVLSKIEALEKRFDISRYGALSFHAERYPLYAVRSRQWDSSNPIVLITGGVHGYETSGVQGAIQFLESAAEGYSTHFNFIVAPCVSPWGYETINRWNPYAVDPNRSFIKNTPSEEAGSLMRFVSSLGVEILAHFDLHETTDTDESEFRPALAARDGEGYVEGTIPDGFYLVGDVDNPQHEFQRAIIEAVQTVTHIAPPDEEGGLIGVEISQHGVINYPIKKLGLCNGFTNCVYGTTTEVYPDSEQVTDQQCNAAQVASVAAGLDFILRRGAARP